MVSIAMAVLPVCRSPRINSRWPRPMGMSASMTLRPVWSGTVTGARSMMGAARAFDGQALAGGHRPIAIERPAERIDDASQQSVAHGHVHDPARALDFIARVQMPVFAEQNDADFVLVHVERDAEHTAGKLHQLLKAHAGEAGDLGDAGGDAGDRAHLPWRQLRRECFPRLAHAGERAVEDALQALGCRAHWLFLGQRQVRLWRGSALLRLDLLASAQPSTSGLASSGLVSGFGPALASDLACRLRSSPTLFSSDAR